MPTRNTPVPYPYARAYLKFSPPAAFAAALLNNQPMGFNSPAVAGAPMRRRMALRPHQRFSPGWRSGLSNFCDLEDGPRPSRLFLPNPHQRCPSGHCSHIHKKTDRLLHGSKRLEEIAFPC